MVMVVEVEEEEEDIFNGLEGDILNEFFYGIKTTTT